MLKQILPFILILSLALCENESGVRIALDQNEVLRTIHFFGPKIVQTLSELKIPDASFDIDAGPFKINIYLFEIKFGVTSYVKESLMASFFEPNIINVVLGNIAAAGSFRVRFKFLFITDVQNVSLKIFNIKANINFALNTKDRQGLLMPNADIIKIDLGIDFDFELHGSVIAEFINLLKPAIKGAISDLLIGTIKDQCNNLLSHSFDLMPTYGKFNEQGLAIDYSLVSAPKISNQFLLFNTRGGFVNVNIPETLVPRYPFPTNLPEYKTDGKRLQAYVSDYTINTALYTMYRSNLLSFAFKPEMIPSEIPIELTTDWFEVMIPGITDVFGTEKLCEVGLSVYQEPVFNFEETKIVVKMNAEMAINVRVDGPNLDTALKMKTEFIIGIDFHVIEEGMFSAYIHDMILQNTSITESKVPTATSEVFQEELNNLVELLQPLLNAYVIKKIHIEIPTVEGLSFTDSTIVHTLHYVTFNLNLRFEEITYGVTIPVPIDQLDSSKMHCGSGKIIKDSKLLKTHEGLFYYDYSCTEVDYHLKKPINHGFSKEEYKKIKQYMDLFE